MSARNGVLALLSLASLGWAMSFSVAATLAPRWMHDAGCSASSVGLNAACYYLGVALASPLVPPLLRNGGRWCVVVGMLLDALTTALFPFGEGVVYWHLLRFVGGVGTAMSLIPMETLVNHNALPQRRARDFSVYAVCVALGIALGPVVGQPLYPQAPRLTFALGGAVTLAATLLAFFLPYHDEEGQAEQGAFDWRSGLFGFGTAWAQGFLEGGTITFLSLYLLSKGHDTPAVSGLLGALFAGVVVAQLPVGWLADRLGRQRVLLACHAVLLVGMAIVPSLTAVAPTGLLLFVLGAACGALYPLGLALLGERVGASGLARANAWYLVSNCAGSLSGPLAVGLAIDAFGLSAQFVLDALAIAAVLLAGALTARRRSAARKDERRRAA